MKIFKKLKKKKNKDVIKSFIEKWKNFEEQKHDAYVEMGFDLAKIIQNDSLKRMVVSDLVGKGWRKTEDGGLVLSKEEVYKYAELKSLSVENLENYVKYYEIVAKLELVKVLLNYINSNSSLMETRNDFIEVFKENLKDNEKLTEEQIKGLEERYSEVYEEINIER